MTNCLFCGRKLEGIKKRRGLHTGYYCSEECQECQECHINQKELGRKLDVHHIDYNKKNNNPANLISLCASCHAQTGFKRGDWIRYLQQKLRGVMEN